MKTATWPLYILLIIGWGYLSLHYWWWLLASTQVDWKYMIVETWMLLSFIVFTAVIIFAFREERVNE